MRVCIETALPKSKDAAVSFSIANIVEKRAGRGRGRVGAGLTGVFFNNVRNTERHSSVFRFRQSMFLRACVRACNMVHLQIH